MRDTQKFRWEHWEHWGQRRKHKGQSVPTCIIDSGNTGNQPKGIPGDGANCPHCSHCHSESWEHLSSNKDGHVPTVPAVPIEIGKGVKL